MTSNVFYSSEVLSSLCFLLSKKYIMLYVINCLLKFYLQTKLTWEMWLIWDLNQQKRKATSHTSQFGARNVWHYAKLNAELCKQWCHCGHLLVHCTTTLKSTYVGVSFIVHINLCFAKVTMREVYELPFLRTWARIIADRFNA